MTNKFQKTYKIPKKYFSSNPFWSSPEMLEFTMESYVLIGLKNMCTYVTLFELADLFGIENVEQIVNKYKFGKPCLNYILNAIDLYKRKDEILNKEVDIELNENIQTFDKDLKKEKVLSWIDNKDINDLYDIVYMMKNNFLTINELINFIYKNRLTYEENYILNAIKSIQATFKKDEEVKYLANKIEKSLIKKYIEIRKKHEEYKCLI